MDYSKNKDILKLISEILEYTENPSPTDTACACKNDGGNCGDDTSTCAPGPGGAYDIASCSCPNGNIIFCPKCPDPCKCKADGGSCGDDIASECPDAGIADTVDCYDGYGIVCNVCPKCPPPPTPTPQCTCGDCGLAYFDIGNCSQTTCNCTGKEPNGNCYYCPVNTITPTSSCYAPCFCNSGTLCDACIPGLEQCVNKQLQTCSDGCIITCGTCEPYPTDTPSPTITDTELCPCDCSDFSSLEECQDWIRINAVGGPWYCVSNPCSPEDGEDCMTNSNCQNLSETPPPTPTGTCPSQDCSTCNGNNLFGYPDGSNCAGCTKNANDACISCFTNLNCQAPNGCPNYPCDFCYHQPKLCGAFGGYATQAECLNALINTPGDEGTRICEPCNIKHTSCSPEVTEICWCNAPAPTSTPTNTVCECSDYSSFGYVNPGACQERGTCFTDDLECPLGGTITCDICCTPTPTNTCKCTDLTTGGIGTPGACFDSESSCSSYKRTMETGGAYSCTCSINTTGCPGSTCYCANCNPATPTPPTQTPTPTVSCVKPPGCCLTANAALALIAGKSLDNRCSTVTSIQNQVSNPNNPPGCPDYTCHSVRLQGSNLTTRPIGQLINGICYSTQRAACTSATSPLCGIPPRVVYAEIYGGGAPNDGEYSNCP